MDHLIELNEFALLKSLPLRVNSYLKGGKMKIHVVELLPLKLYPFTYRKNSKYWDIYF